jgi:hypothetical protein
VFTPFRLNGRKLEQLEHRTLHRIRSRSIFRGPLLICLKAGSEASAERGRYSAAVHRRDVLYTQNFYGLSFQDADPIFAYALSGILNSSMASFQFAFGGPTWGLERPTVEPHDLLSLRVPNLPECDRELIASVVMAEREAASDPTNANLLISLDKQYSNSTASNLTRASLRRTASPARDLLSSRIVVNASEWCSRHRLAILSTMHDRLANPWTPICVRAASVISRPLFIPNV